MLARTVMTDNGLCKANSLMLQTRQACTSDKTAMCTSTCSSGEALSLPCGAEIDPGDVNAAKYLDAVRQRMARQTAGGPAAAEHGERSAQPGKPSAAHRPAVASNGQLAPQAGTAVQAINFRRPWSKP